MRILARGGLGGRGAAAVLEREGAGRVVQDLDGEAAVCRLARGRVDAHVGHVAGDRDGVDTRGGEDLGERRPGEVFGEISITLGTPQPPGFRAAGASGREVSWHGVRNG